MAAELLTPVEYAKGAGIKPQPVYNWIKKGGAPVHWKNGRPYVRKAEMDRYRKDKDKKATQRRKVKREKKEVTATLIPQEYINKLAQFGGSRCEHFCQNCGKKTEFLVDITYTGIVPENHIRSFCLECKLNHRIVSMFNLRGVTAKG